MAGFIGVPLKKTNEVDLVKPLRNLFSSYCISADEPVQYDNALNELQKLRYNSTWKAIDRTESSLEVMTKYYDQLTSLETKCPSVEFPVAFKWKDAFDKGSIFMGSTSLTLPSVMYERLCILFNIGAMQSQIAVDHGSDTRSDDALKLAAKYFQLSSGTFWHLKSMIPDLRHDPTPDLQPDTLAALYSLMLAQAQESFFHKAVTDNMKDSIIAKVASQCEDHYAEALRHMQKDATRVVWEKEWMSVVAGKQAGFQALAEFYQSLVCKQKKEVGEEVARLKHALELIKLAEVRGGASVAIFKDYSNKISFGYEEAQKDNDFIYHARVPDIKSLPPIGKAPLAKATPLPAKLNPNSQDLFADLLPMPVQQAVQAFETRKIEIINVEKAKILSQTQLLNGVLASLNLPAALEDTTGDSIPQSLLEKSQNVQQKGGSEALIKLIQDLPGNLQRNREILNECSRMLSDEEDTDNKLRAQHKASWSRTPSTKLNEPLKATIDKYNNTVINNAMNADEVVRQKFEQNKEKIDMLCLSEGELLARIPKGSPVAVCSSAEELKRLMDEVRDLLYERTSLKDELESKTTDMKTRFLTALAQDGCINENTISVAALEDSYGSLQRNIQDNLEKQDHLVAEIQRLNTEFCKEKDSKQSAADRETCLKDLASAHDVFVELSGNLEEGSRFYNNLTQILVCFQNKISDFCFARKTEREELCKELQKTIVSEANKQQSPQAPSHHAQTAKPIRPPPPKTNSYVPPASVSAPVAPSAAALPYPPDLGQMTGMPQYPAAYPTYSAPYPYPAMPPTAYYPYPQVPMGGIPQYPPVTGYQAHVQPQQAQAQADQYQQPNYQQYPPQQPYYPPQQQQQQQHHPWHQ